MISSLIFYGAGMVSERVCISDRHYFLELILCIVLVGGVRFVARNVRENMIQTRPVESIQQIALVGPLKKVQPLLKEFLSDSDSLYRPIAILDPEMTFCATTRISDVPLFTLKQALAKPKRTAWSRFDCVLLAGGVPESHGPCGEGTSAVEDPF